MHTLYTTLQSSSCCEVKDLEDVKVQEEKEKTLTLVITNCNTIISNILTYITCVLTCRLEGELNSDE